MTIWGICRSCLGDVFEEAGEVERLAVCYQKCWKEMEVRGTMIGRRKGKGEGS